MKISLDSFNTKLGKYISEELSASVSSPWLKFMLGAAGACSIRLETAVPEPLLQASGIVDKDGLVDLDRLGAALKGGFQAQHEVTVAGLLRFTAADAEAFLRYIETQQ